MQNAGPSYQGSATPGVNYTDHTYDSQGPHCQSNNYQPYMNTTYHPLQSPRSHHYGNHQMHQMAPYGPVHHSGTYTPAQNQYRPSAQDMYRNHHPAYVGVNNNHSMPAKSAAWGENNTPSTDVIQSYNQMPPQPQMMNTSQMPVSAMRSPPQGASLNINATQSPVPQHYRQLQSPNDSPHSWPQVQAPSPGVLHSARTTPSPISAHVRSPGISQPFSPPPVTHHSPASINVQQHTSSSVVPENDQCSALGNVSSCETTSNPLHSLQKMVMLDQELKPNLIQVTCEINESCEQASNQSSAQSVSAEQQVVGTESKDSSYPTYLTLGENCLDSQAEAMTSEATSSSSVLSSSPLSNCNLPGSEKLQDSTEVANDALQTAVSTVSEETGNVSTVSEQPSPSVNTCTEPSSETIERLQNSPAEANLSSVNNDECAVVDALCKPSSPVSEKQNLNAPESSENLLKTCEEEKTHVQVPESSVPSKGPSIVKLSVDVANINKTKDSNEVAEKEVSCDVNTDSTTEASKKINRSPKRNLRRCNAGVNYEETPSPESVSRLNPLPSAVEVKQEQRSPRKLKEAEEQQPIKKLVNSDDISKKEEPVNKAPVKVVIHRIRKSNTDDTWHVPNSSDCSVANKDGDKQSGVSCADGNNDPPKAPNIGPQIIILSSAMSKKKFGITGSPDSNSVITIDEDNTVIETVEGKADIDTSNVLPKKKLVQRSPRKTENSPRKKGRTPGGKSKARSSATKKGKGKKVSKKRKKEMVEVEVIPKIKKSKIFSGPYVHITGSKESPLSITVVNVAPREEEKDQKNQKPKRDFTNTANSIQRKHRVGHSSTLSPSYDAFNKDKTWVCAFCHKGSHHQGLGDLYGPYYIIDNKENKAITSECSSSEKFATPPNTRSPSTPQSSNRGIRSKRKRSDLVDDYIKSSVTKKRPNKKSGPNSIPATSPVESTPSTTVEIPVKNESQVAVSPETEKFKEVWVHEDCVVWCHGVSLMGQQLHGLEEAIRDALQNKCSSCKLVGATLGCRSKACTEQYHFGCAKEKGCEMDIEVFSLLCPKHLRKEFSD